MKRLAVLLATLLCIAAAATDAARAQAPDTTIDGGPSSLTRDRTPSFSFASTTAGATFQCRIDGLGSPRPALGPCHAPYRVPELPDGAFTLVVQAVAPGGAVDPAPATRSFTVDGTPPQTVVTGGPPDGGETGERSPQFTYTAEPGARFECRLDNVARNGTDTVGWQSCAPGGYSPESLAGGRHVFEVRAIDAAGNEDPTPAVVRFRLRACDRVVHFALVEATGECLEGVGTPDAPRWESEGGIKLNGIPLPAPGAAKIVLGGPTPAHPGGTLAIDGITLTVGGIQLFRGRLAWTLPDGGPGDEREVTRLEVGGQKLFGLTIQGDLALRLKRSADDVYSAVLALHIMLPDAFKNGPNTDAGGVTGDVSIRIDAAGAHLDGLKIAVSNAYVGSLVVHSVCLSFVAAGAAGVEPCQPPAIGGVGSEPYLQCQSDNTADRWDGAFAIVLPTASKTEVGMWAGLRAGRLAYAGGFAENLGTAVPLAPGVFLQRIALAVCLEPPPFQLKGGAGISFGPDFNGGQAIRVNGNFLYRDASNGQPWLIRADGELLLFDRRIATAYVQYQGSGMLDFGFDADLKFGPLRVAGGVNGWVETQGQRRFNVTGYVLVCVDSIACADATAVISSRGVAGCITVTLFSLPVLVKDADWVWWEPWRVHWESQPVSVTGGAGYTWSTRAIDLMAGSCSVGNWTEARAAQAPGGVQVVRVPEGEMAVSFRVIGLGGPPRVTLVGPHGERIVMPDRPGGAFRKDHYLIASDPATQTTAIMVPKPAAGNWRIEPHPGSPRILRVEDAAALPPVALAAGVGGRGHGRILGYIYRPRAGQHITFVERTSRGDRIIGRADDGLVPCRRSVEAPRTNIAQRCGRLRFRPGIGKSGTRRIVAYVEQDGEPRTVRTVTHYEAPAPLRPDEPARVRIVRDGRDIVVRWTQVSGAAGYTVAVRVGDGRRLAFARSASTRAVRIPRVLGRYDVRAQVRALRRDGAVGDAEVEVMG